MGETTEPHVALQQEAPLFPAFTDDAAGKATNIRSTSSLDSTVPSEATTAVLDNRTLRSSDIRPFFASTKPSSGAAAAAAPPNGGLVPESPPPIQRGARTVSTTTLVAGSAAGGAVKTPEDQHLDGATNPLSSVLSPPAWEEEATPEQTAFGKKLLLAREELEGGSEANLSTASEFGTVIDMEQRMADVSDMERDGQQPTYSEPIWDKELSLPVLEDSSSSSSPTQTIPQPLMDRDSSKSADDVEEKPSLFSTIRRIGSGLKDGSLSAPTTPRIQQPPTPLSSPPALNYTPSFLRSPGSSAFMEEKKRKKKILTPRFSSRFHRERVAKIDEDKVITSVDTAPNPFQIARSCFSFDYYDTALDDNEESLPPVTDDRYYDNVGGNPSGIRLEQARPAIQSSASWDIGMATSAFRPLLTPTRQNGHQRPIELQTPQRIEFEREDALDILSCLVERGVALSTEEAQKEEEPTKVSKVASTEPEKTVQEVREPSNENVTVPKVIEELRAFCKSSADSDSRLAALDELVRSHEYAMEMKRASKSAKSWLQSIDRENTEGLSPQSPSPSCAKLSPSTPKIPVPPSPGDMDLVTAKAMMRSAQVEAQTKTALADRLNVELAKCRAEIGRLRTASQVSAFKSPNRSILDESDENDEGDDEEEEENLADVSFDSAVPVLGINQGAFMNSSFLQNGVQNESASNNSKEEGIDSYRAALALANDQICQLHNELQELNGGSASPKPAPIVTLNESPGNKEKRTVNVNMLDGENFVTEWTELSPALPPPPDHDLHSPIVEAVLEQWSSDKSLHQTLMDWMTQVLEGRADSVTPLTLSSLDHQVRDGFVMHILPLLLRRADVRVDVQSRVRRTTTYDLSVSVEPSFMIRQRHWENVSAQSEVGGTSTATTALASNHIRRRLEDESGRRLTYDEVVEHGMSSDPQPGLISALGGALGGLLRHRNSKESTHATSPSGDPATVAMAESHRTANQTDDATTHEPFHRVVSAPAGRIGVTFIEYRGHAMVSDVSADSPLQGWMHPTDVLIAIDELPVHGMKLRDIIQVLRDRQLRQRALRVISSHGMTEPAVNISHVRRDEG